MTENNNPDNQHPEKPASGGAAMGSILTTVLIAVVAAALVGEGVAELYGPQYRFAIWLGAGIGIFPILVTHWVAEKVLNAVGKKEKGGEQNFWKLFLGGMLVKLLLIGTCVAFLFVFFEKQNGLAAALSLALVYGLGLIRETNKLYRSLLTT